MQYDEFMILEMIKDYLSDIEQEDIEDIYVKMTVDNGTKRLIFTIKSFTDETDLNMDLQLGDYLRGTFPIE